ncbi:unnamed protein product, partial [Rotaria sp. Silwood2]
GGIFLIVGGVFFIVGVTVHYWWTYTVSFVSYIVCNFINCWQWDLLQRPFFFIE